MNKNVTELNDKINQLLIDRKHSLLEASSLVNK